MTGLNFVNWSELRESVPAEPDWILDGYIARSNHTMIAGKPKGGKSTWSVDLAAAVDFGAPDFCGREIAHAGPVVYISEEGAGTFAAKLPLSTESVVLTRDGAWPKPAWAELIAAATQKALEIGAVLIVFDSIAYWAQFAEGAEKDAGAAQATMDAFTPATSAGLAVLSVHHQRKGGGEDGDAVRGSGAIFGAVDTLIELERLGEGSRANQRRLVAVGRWPQTPSVLVVDRDHHGAWRAIGEAVDRADSMSLGVRERILAALPATEPGCTEPELGELLDLDARKISKPLRDLVGDRVERVGEGVKGKPYRYFRKPPADSPQMLPKLRGENGSRDVSKFSPSPLGGENRNESRTDRAEIPPADPGSIDSNLRVAA